jgi:hypothetical protein
MGLRSLGQVEEHQYHLESFAPFALRTLHNDAATVDVDGLIPSRPRLGQTHLHANFSPFGQICVGEKGDALGTQTKNFIENGSLAGAFPFQLRVKDS